MFGSSSRGRGVALLAVMTALPPLCVATSRPIRAALQRHQATPADSDVEVRIRELEAKVRELAATLEVLRNSPALRDGDRLAELEKQIDLLTREIERLKLGEAAAPPAGASRHGFGPAASRVYQIRQGVSLGGYGELAYQDFDRETDVGSASGRTDSLDLLRAVFYIGYKWNDRILFNSEIEFEHATTGEGAEEKGEVSVEFAYVDFLVRRGINARAGLLLVPVGFLNELHEPPIFHGVRRPEVERVILPATWRENGAGIFGDLGKFSYRAYLLAGLDASGFSSGDAVRDGRQGGSESKAEDFALAGRVDLTGVPGILAGIAIYAGDSGQGAIRGGARVSLADAHLQYQWRGVELRGLFASGSIRDVSQINALLGLGGDESVGKSFGGWYAQAAWDLLSLRQRGTASLSPFLRYEEFNTQDGVPPGFLENPGNDRSLRTFGLTWKPIPQVAVKVDFQDSDNEAGTGVDQFNVGLGWLF